MRRIVSFGLFALAALLAPAALAQVPQPSCGVPPQPVVGSIPFSDITAQLGYQVLAAPTADTMSDYTGGNGEECEVNGNYELYSQGPWATPELAGTITLPFPFGFSGVYYDGGSLNTPFQVDVWANGLLTFDPSVSFSPFANPQQDVPADCSTNYYDPSNAAIIQNGTVADTLGGFPFAPKYNPPNGPPSGLIAPWWGDLSLCPRNGSVGWILTLDDQGVPMVIIQWTNATASPPLPANCQNQFNCYGDFSACTDTSQQPLYPGATLPQ
ncbi:MAG: hypothetical protein ACRDYC_12035, partial [Acidimicrobiales bacterium]